MREIELTKGYVALVDDEDYNRVNSYCSWQAKVNPKKNGKVVYAFTNKWNNGVQSYLAMHRFIMNLNVNDPQIDHEDGNGLNNQKYNLRLCINKQNARNKPKSEFRQFTSQYKGVNWKSKIKRWIAQISCDHNKMHLGCFDTQEEAARAYDRKALELFGEFAKTNFPREEYLQNV